MLAHFSRDVCEDLVAVRQLDAKHRIGQCFYDRAFNLDYAIFVSQFFRSLAAHNHTSCGWWDTPRGHDTPKYENTRQIRDLQLEIYAENP